MSEDKARPTTEVPCFICGKILTKDDSHIEEKYPTSVGFLYDGLIFRATGNYGSTIFDPIPDDGFIEIAICDECVSKKAEQVKRVKNIRHKVEADVCKFEICG